MLHVSRRSRDGRVDSETVPIACDGGDVLGADVEAWCRTTTWPSASGNPVRRCAAATYALVATGRLRTTRGRASDAFRTLGLPRRTARGPEAIFTDDPLDARNLLPASACCADGTVVVPTASPTAACSRCPPRRGVFSPASTGAARSITGSAPTRSPWSATASSVSTTRRQTALPGRGRDDVPPDALERERARSPAVAAATVFPVEDLPAELATIRAQIRSRPAPSTDFTDPIRRRAIWRVPSWRLGSARSSAAPAVAGRRDGTGQLPVA
jgi:hypothetical protein